MEKVKVSIIIPVFNRADLLKDTLESVRNQTFHSFECIIVDDGSSDYSFEIATAMAGTDNRFRVFTRPDSMMRGANSCRNFGLQMSRGEFIKWLDSDDLLAPICIEKQFDIMSETSADVCLCQASYFSEERNGTHRFLNKIWGRITPRIDFNIIDDYLLSNLRWQTASGLWRKTALPDRPFFEGLKNSQEWLMHLSMLALGISMVYLQDQLVHVRIHSDSMSNSSKKKGDYYYHQCWARVHALRLLRKKRLLTKQSYRQIINFVFWNHLFIFIKGAPLKGLKFFRYYPEILLKR